MQNRPHQVYKTGPSPLRAPRTGCWGRGLPFPQELLKRWNPRRSREKWEKGGAGRGWYWGEVCSSKDSLEGTAASHHQVHLLREAWTRWFCSCKKTSMRLSSPFVSSVSSVSTVYPPASFLHSGMNRPEF